MLAKKFYLLLPSTLGKGNRLRWKRSYVLSRFFNISIFTFETSIVGYADTFPRGESKKG